MNIPKKLVLVSPLPDEYVAKLRVRFPSLDIVDCKHDKDRVIKEIETAHFFFGRPTREQFLRAQNLEFIQVWTQGIESILFPELIRSDVLVANGRGIWSPAIAEHILAMILAFYRALPSYWKFQTEKVWVQREITLDLLAGKTVCFLGTGDIAQHTVRLLTGFRCTVVGVNKKGKVPEGFHEVVTRNKMLPLISRADVIVCTLPFTPDTKRFVDAAAFSAMKRSAIFINVGRGKTVDENALIHALQEGRIAGAGLDVLEKEPPEPSNPLWTMPNVIITSHVAGLYVEHAQRAYELLVENLERVLAGIPPKNLIDKKQGY